MCAGQGGETPQGSEPHMQMQNMHMQITVGELKDFFPGVDHLRWSCLLCPWLWWAQKTRMVMADAHGHGDRWYFHYTMVTAKTVSKAKKTELKFMDLRFCEIC